MDYKNFFTYKKRSLPVSGKVALLADVHANFPALSAVLTCLAELKISAIWFLGDALGRGPFPLETYQWMNSTFHQKNSNWVKGNHEDWVLGTNGDDWKKEANPVFVQSDLKERQEIEHIPRFPGIFKDGRETIHHSFKNGFDFFLSHEGSTHPDVGYIYPWDIKKSEQVFDLNSSEYPAGNSRLILFAHSHIPALFRRSRQDRQVNARMMTPRQAIYLDFDHDWMINPGSVGNPYDGDPRASFAILDLHEMQVMLLKKEYPVETTVTQLANKHYPPKIMEDIRNAPMPFDTPLEWVDHFEKARQVGDCYAK